ncbi:type II secretion system F family protein [Robbsia andropogonis]|uniref:type II secretion system F family protein n=2 Tax=Robbsia andropogonis TaxID=28092 RepID=UPI00056354B8|nr:type II secretion system F family protein [Robbsia andropogonis]
MHRGRRASTRRAGPQTLGDAGILRRMTGVKAVRVTQAHTLMRQLGELLTAGIDIVEALDVLSASTANVGVAALALRLKRQLLHGKSLSDALGDHPRLFDRTSVMLVRQSERAGTLGTALCDAANLCERQAAYRIAIRRALAYPIFVCCVSIGLMTGLMIWSVPAFAQLFASFDAPLPVLTQWIIALSAGLRDGLASLLRGVGLGAAIGVTLALLRATPALRTPIDATCARWRGRGRRVLSTCADAVPGVASWRRNARFAGWGMALATLLDAGIPLHDALRAMADGDPGGAQGTQAMLQRFLAGKIAHGATLAQAMRASHAFNEDALRLTAVAERTGALASMLGALARRQRAAVHDRIEQCIRWIEPAALLVCGAVVGVVILALYLPIIKLGEVI